MEVLGIDSLDQLEGMSNNELERKIRNWDAVQWLQELEEKSTLDMYKNNKREIREESMYDNTFSSVLLFRARANCLKLRWRRRFEGESTECQLCGNEVETTDHFIAECTRLGGIREQFGVVGVQASVILRFSGSEDTEKMKRYLECIWKERERIGRDV